jgi:pimeloyl-ACP methyl ester carboxylesterase
MSQAEPLIRDGHAPPDSLQTLVDHYDPAVFAPERGQGRVRLTAGDGEAWDVELNDGHARIAPARGHPDAVLTADGATWAKIASDARGGLDAFREGRLSVRRNLHLGTGFLAATSQVTGPGRLRFATVSTRRVHISTIEAGIGPAVIAVHGLGATKGSFLPTVAALSGQFRMIALDLPGFGDSDKPIGARYDARYFADVIADLLDALELDRAHLIGNSLGGRIALEVGFQHPERVDRLGLLAPSLAWRRSRPWASLLRLTRPELGLLQLAPRPVVEAIVNRVVPGAGNGWAAAGVDEFLRAYLTPSGRAAFYAAARHIYLEAPDGDTGFWTRLPNLSPEALFVWGRKDTLVPISFERHVHDALPSAQHLELDCGHVPQIERPRETNSALAEFFAH